MVDFLFTGMETFNPKTPTETQLHVNMRCGHGKYFSSSEHRPEACEVKLIRSAAVWEGSHFTLMLQDQDESEKCQAIISSSWPVPNCLYNSPLGLALISSSSDDHRCPKTHLYFNLKLLFCKVVLSPESFPPSGWNNWAQGLQCWEVPESQHSPFTTACRLSSTSGLWFLQNIILTTDKHTRIWPTLLGTSSETPSTHGAPQSREPSNHASMTRYDCRHANAPSPLTPPIHSLLAKMLDLGSGPHFFLAVCNIQRGSQGQKSQEQLHKHSVTSSSIHSSFLAGQRGKSLEPSCPKSHVAALNMQLSHPQNIFEKDEGSWIHN